MILVDSCGWIEYLADGDKAEEYAKHFLDPKEIATPTIVIYEVFKKILKERGEEAAVMVAAQMSGTRVIELSEMLSLTAASISEKYNLPMADAIVYATAELLGCRVVTSDKHFKDLGNVIYV